MPNPRLTRHEYQARSQSLSEHLDYHCSHGAGLLGLLLLLVLPVMTRAQIAAPPFSISRSVSGQFVVQSSPPAFGSPMAGLLQNDTNFVELDPTLLTVSCERIKQILFRDLGSTEPWTGKILLRLYSAGSADSPIAIDAEQFRDRWQYRVSLPNFCQRERYVRAIVSVLLLEMANRQPGSHSAEVPAWLREGLSREIWASNQKEVILTRPQMSDAGLRMTTLLVNARKENSLDRAHQQLCAATPLNFQQLSWPVPDSLTGEPTELYRNCAQVFVRDLMSLPNGQTCLRTMIQQLPRFYNWQFAFLAAFHDHFRETLDVEKWWSLELVHFTGRELTDRWGSEESWEKLDQVVRSAVQIRIGTNELPLRGEVALQTIIRDWPVPRQTQALETKLRELQMLRPRLVRDLALITDDYCRAIETYLQNLNHPGFVLPFRKGVVARHNAAEIVLRLDELDSRRATIRPPKPELTPPADLRSASLH
ncbi:MAG TPA: hypothetical protein VL793_07470 [Patescibacteria group bacterium]|nr:hypothetical protein [Patescibacteria group bacterium]